MFIKKVEETRVSGPYPGGKHVRMVHQEKGIIIPIPMHKGKDVSIGLIREIIREADTTREEWIKI